MAQEQANVGEAVEAVAGILTGKPIEPSVVADAPTDGQAAPDPQAVDDSGELPMTPTLLAQSLGIKPDELFKQFLIPVDGGDPLTMEEFKAAGTELRGVKAAQDELAERIVEHENGVMMQRQMMQRAVAKIPPDVLTQEMVAEVQQEHQQHVTTERRELLAIRPDLESPAKWDSTRRLLISHLKPYGFREIEIDGIIDHRMAKYVIDNAERQQRVAKLNADGIQVEETSKLQAPSAQPPRTPRKRAETKSAAKRGTNTVGDKTAKVAALLGAKT